MPSGEGLRYLGAITGTSVDGLDIALIRMDGASPSLLAQDTAALPATLRTTLIDLGQSKGDRLDALGAADAALGRFIGEAVKSFMQRQGLTAAQVRAIGSHGQTVRHRPEGEPRFSMQIGDPNIIAEVTGVTTVADFRRRDLAAKGEGAPLAPSFHAAILGGADELRVVLNIGGISNISVLRQPLVGFDTGPGNALLDDWCRRHRGQSYDADGAWAATGRLDRQLLQILKEDPYLARPPPKSTGKEHYNLGWLAKRLRPSLKPEDVQRTLAEFTAAATVEAIQRWAPGAKRIIVCGGGRSNAFLMRRLAELAEAPVEAIDQHGWDGDAVEASAFAWLAHQRLTGTPANAPEVTGAQGPRVLGGVYAP